MKIGDHVRVRLPRNGGVQEGTVTAVGEGGVFRWKNRCNYQRKSTVDRLTSEPEREGVLSPYMREWVSEERRGELDDGGEPRRPPGTRRG